jgi:predicted Ser/Thr protein kinase
VTPPSALTRPGEPYPGLTRADLAARTVEVLSRGGWGNPDVFLVECAGGLVVVKDFRPRSWWLRWTWGAWANRREARAYRALEGLASVPRLLGRLDRHAFVLEYRAGTQLSRSLVLTVPREFISELTGAVSQMHARGVVHLDLRHRSNVLAGEDGHPVLLDFASALCFRPGGWFARWALPWLARIDLGALHKWDLRLGEKARAQAGEP